MFYISYAVSIRMKFTDLPKHINYRIKFQTRKWLGQKPKNGFSIVIVTYNRSRFLSQTLNALVNTCNTPFEIIIWDNCSTDSTRDVCQTHAQSHQCIHYIKHTSNIGTSAFALAILEAKYRYIVEVDDDILAIQENWQQNVMDAFEKVPDLAYLALNVIQDEFTNGAKPKASAYQEECFDGVKVESGPVGGWFAVTTREYYDQLNGFKFKPDEIFFLEDGDYCKKVKAKRLVSRILKDTYVYHASGAIWNYAFEYRDVWVEKYQSYPGMLKFFDNLTVEKLPTIETAVNALRRVTSAK